MNYPTHRDKLGHWLNDNGLIQSGAEIGCAWGAFAKTILSSWAGKKYFMIDPWQNLPSNEYLENQESCEYEKWFNECLDLASNDHRVILMRSKSIEAVNQFQDGSLDFVYIDAAHDYRNVIQDMNAWFPKVKEGGLFAGHDFLTNPDGPIFVEDAVKDWTFDMGLNFHVTPCTSWWIVKSKIDNSCCRKSTFHHRV